MATPDYKAAKTRSVDNLQRLYTVVVSLAITESLRRLISGVVGSSDTTDYTHWLMFVSLLVTLVPFYHGANRYLDATYVTMEREAKRGTLMIDFLFLFVEGLAFFAIAALIPRGAPVFYTGLAMLFVLDAIWVGLTNLTAAHDSDRMPGYTKWAIANGVAASFLLLMVWTNTFTGTAIWRDERAGHIALMVTALVRTIYDYVKVWPFYYPKGIDLIPAPAPAPLPQVPSQSP